MKIYRNGELRDFSMYARAMGHPVGYEYEISYSELSPLQLKRDGSLVQRKVYPELWEFAQAHPSILLNDEDWQDQVLLNDGFCNSFSSGDGSTTFRVPLAIASREDLIPVIQAFGFYDKNQSVDNATVAENLKKANDTLTSTTETLEEVKQYLENEFVGSTEDADGEKGIVPAPTIEDRHKYLGGDGTWKEITEIADFNTNGLYEGLNVVPISNKDVIIASGKAIINHKSVYKDDTSLVTLPSNSRGLLVLGNDNKFYTKTASFPKKDDHTIVQYDFSEKVNDRIIKDLGPNSIDATIKGKVITVPGLNGKTALRFDGLTGCAETTKTIPMPLGATDKQVDVVFEINNDITSECEIYSLYPSAANQNFLLYCDSYGKIFFWDGTTSMDTQTYAVPGKLFYIAVRYSNEYLEVYINGRLTVRTQKTMAHVEGKRLRFAAGYSATANKYAACTLYYFELRDKVRSIKEINEITNKLIIPAEYYDKIRNYPTQHLLLKPGTEYHEYCVNGLAIKDSGNATEKTTPELVGELGLTVGDFGETPWFRSNVANYINCGTLSLNKDKGWTVVAIIKNYGNHSDPVRFLGIGNSIWGVGEGADNDFGVWLNGTWYNTDDYAAWKPFDYNFIVAKYDPIGSVHLSLNSYKINTSHKIILPTITGEVSIGFSKGHDNYYPWPGEVPYVAIFDRMLEEAEVKEIFDQYDSIYENKYNLTSLIDTDKASLGYFRTDDNNIINYDFENRRYGRIELGKNNVAESGWLYIQKNQVLKLENKLGTSNIDIKIYGNPNFPSFKNAVTIDSIYSSGAYGTWNHFISDEEIWFDSGNVQALWNDSITSDNCWINVVYELNHNDDIQLACYTQNSISENLQETLNKFQQHNHSTDTEQKIVTESLGENVVTTEKIADKNVTQNKLADNAVGTSQISNGSVTIDKISDTVVDEIVNQVNKETAESPSPIDKHTDGLVSGLDVSLTDNKLIISQGSYRDNGILNTLSEAKEIQLEEDSIGYVNLITNPDGGELDFEVKYTSTGSTGGSGGEEVKEFTYPEVTDDFCFQYKFDSRGDDDATLKDYSDNHIDMTIVGGVALTENTDEIFPTAYRFDGITGYLNTGKEDNMPTGKETWELNLVFKLNRKGVEQHIFRYGNQNLNGINVYVTSGNLLQIHGATTVPADNFEIIPGVLYWLTIQYDGYWLIYRINGEEIYRQQNVTYNITSNDNVQYDQRFGSWIAAGFYIGAAMYMYYADLRKNIVRTTYEIQYEMYKCGYRDTYQDKTFDIPNSRKNSEVHEYLFVNDEEDTTIKDNIGTMNLIAQDTTTADVQYHYTNTRTRHGKHILIKAVSNQWFKGTENFNFKNEWTIVAQYLPYSLSGYPTLVSNITNVNPSGVALLSSQNGNAQPTIYINKTGYMSSATEVEVNELCTVIVTLKDGVLYFYVNSAEEPVATYLLDYNETWEAPLQIGAWNNNDYILTSEVYYIKVANYGFTKQEIQEHFDKLLALDNQIEDEKPEEQSLYGTKSSNNGMKFVEFSTLTNTYKVLDLRNATEWSTKDFIWQGKEAPTDETIRFWLDNTNTLRVRTEIGTWDNVGAYYNNKGHLMFPDGSEMWIE